jgi:hypothetical protein
MVRPQARGVGTAERGPGGTLDRLFGIDGRSLAAFRVALGAVVVADLATRAADLEAHYTDAGVLPREAFHRLFALSDWYWSLHLWTGSFAGQAVLFGAALVAACALVVGYRTRLAAAVTWFLTVSLQARNPMILYGADQLIRMLLFWSLFLPLGAEWSLDRRRDAAPQDPPRRHLSAATAALLLQPCLMYVFSGALKQNPSWHSGAALSYALSSDMFATPLGHRLLAYPHLLQRLTPVVPWFEMLVPVALFVPWATMAFRTAALLFLAGFHLVLGLLFATGLFQYVALAGLLPFVPGGAWDRLARLMPAHRLPRPVAGPPGTGRPPPEPARRWLAAGGQLLVAGLFLYVVAWNVAGLRLEEYSTRNSLPWIREWWAAGHQGIPLTFRDYVVERMMGDLGWIGRVAGLQQRWDMFYRTSVEDRGWHIVVGTLHDGREISLLEGGRPLEGGTRSRPASVADLYPTTRWATYFAYLRTPGAEPARRLLPPVIARRWARQRPDLPIETLRIVFVQDLPTSGGGSPEHREKLWYEGPPQGPVAGAADPGPYAARRSTTTGMPSDGASVTLRRTTRTR